ncbi:MAG: transporter substrate-binding domain-containing protein [Streptosporangiales bacterium]|nr:transporter substrate-binding domain-containing protein [Streptosporangiales bacterium]
MVPHRRRTFALAAGAVAATLVLVSCGGGKEQQAPPAKGASAPLFDELPKQYQDSKVIKVGSDIAYAPMEFYDEDGKTPIGIDVDIAKALGEQLGVRFEFQNGTFDGLIVALGSKRHDIIMSSMTDNKDRQEGRDPDTGKKVGPGVDFVDYYMAGVSIMVQKGNPSGIKSVDDLCGKVVAYQRGTIHADAVEAHNEENCKPRGLPMVLHDKAKDTEALLEVKQGRAVADVNDTPVAVYNAKTSGGGNDFEVVGAPFDAGPLGIAVRKEDTQLRDALLAAVREIVKNGTYTKIMKKWGATTGAINLEQVKVNGGT